MPKRVSQHLGVSKNGFAATGAFDAILDIDTHLFIDPLLLRATQVPEFSGSIKKVEKRFAEILSLLKASKATEDIFWRQAEKLMFFPEVKGICIGYSREGTAGSGMGVKLRKRLMESAKAIIDAGIQEPDIFELAGLFEDGIGPDRISDMIAGIIQDDLFVYTERVLVDLGALQPRKADEPFVLPGNPFNDQSITLVPREFLRDLPLALDWTDIPIVAAENEALRKEVNDLIGSTWRSAAFLAKKDDVKKTLLKHPELLKKLIDDYRKRAPEPYDFDGDPAGQVVWFEASAAAAAEHQLLLKLPEKPTIEDLRSVVLEICKKFRELIEDHGLWRLLYHKGKRKHEEASQLLFFGVANAYCEANNVSISRESNGGRGPVDFKFSRGYALNVVVEAKLTSNKELINGLKKQIVAYAEAEKASRGIYLVIDNGGASPNRLREFNTIVANNGSKQFEVMFVDGTPKQSASKLR